LSLRQIAAGLGRAPSTISREVEANGGRSRYRAARRSGQRPRVAAQGVQAGQRPRGCRRLVEAKLKLKWSPEQIAGWLKRTYPDEVELQVSHETIYRTCTCSPVAR
jgi:IS30 family transposase